SRRSPGWLGEQAAEPGAELPPAPLPPPWPVARRSKSLAPSNKLLGVDAAESMLDVALRAPPGECVMNRRGRVVRWAGVAGLVVVVGTLATFGGPLDPPAGPVAPTGKTLTEVQPRTAVNAANTPGTPTAVF